MAKQELVSLNTSEFDEAFKDGQVEELNATFVEFKEPGQAITGRLLSWDDITPEEGKIFKKYVFDTGRGLVAFLGGAQIDPVLAQLQNVDRIIRVIYEGVENLKAGRKMKKFKVLALKQ